MSIDFPQGQRGLSLVELMIALLLSTLLIGGVLQMFLSSKQTYSTNNALFRVQENGRFAMEFLAYDLRNAGYKGECMGAPNNLLNESSPSYSEELFDLTVSVMGWENGTRAGITGRVAGTDSILLKHAAVASGATATGNTGITANTIGVTGASNIPADSIVLVADALGCDVFQTQNNQSGNSLSRGAQGTPGNKNPGSHNFSHAYGSDMEILKLHSALYYIGTGGNGLPALRRVTYNTGASNDQELVEGIHDMQITYGTVNANRQVTGEFVAASSSTDWENVAAVRIELLAVSADANVVQESQQLTFNGATVTVPDRRLGQVFTTTFSIRNRLP